MSFLYDGIQVVGGCDVHLLNAHGELDLWVSTGDIIRDYVWIMYVCLLTYIYPHLESPAVALSFLSW